MSDIRPHPFISVLIPTLNEEPFIVKCLDSLLEGGYPRERLEIVLADGGSSDRTTELLSAYHQQEPRVRWISNPLVHQAGGVNAAARAAASEAQYFIRVDAHAVYPDRFLLDVVAVSEETSADLVVYVNEPQFETEFQRAVAFALSHPLGVGDSKYRLGTFCGEVEHGQHGCFKRECFLRLNGYDPAIMPNEDAELSFRVRQAGGKVYLSSSLRMKYFPRRTISGLCRQYFLYGFGRALNCSKHRTWPHLRQLAPPALVAIEIILFLGGLFQPLLLTLLLPYLFLLTAISLYAAFTLRTLSMLQVGPVLWTMHHFWGVGFYFGILEAARRVRVQVQPLQT